MRAHNNAITKTVLLHDARGPAASAGGVAGLAGTVSAEL
jgi:hypothetical protein